MEPVTLGCIVFACIALFFAGYSHLRLRSLKISYQKLRTHQEEIKPFVHKIITKRIIEHLYKQQNNLLASKLDAIGARLTETASLSKPLQAEKYCEICTDASNLWIKVIYAIGFKPGDVIASSLDLETRSLHQEIHYTLSTFGMRK